MSELGNLIRSARQSKGLSQRELGDLTGFRNSYIAKIELGRQRGSYFALVKIAAALDIPLNVIAREFGLNNNHRQNFTPADYQFSKLPPKLKAALLDISEKLEGHI